METKLLRYNGYREKSLPKWKDQMALPDNTIKKLLEQLLVFSSREVRNILRAIIKKNSKIFERENCYICKFGGAGKSGEILIYEFRHTFPKYSKKLIETWDIPNLPEESTIVFVDDLVGSGNQSISHVHEKLNALLSPSFDAYLLCICATPQGKKHVESNSNVSIIEGMLLGEAYFQFLSKACKIFDEDEKKHIFEINKRLNYPDLAGGYGNLGLLIAFYFTIPNNTLPFIWKDGYVHTDETGKKNKWFALLPRDY